MAESEERRQFLRTTAAIPVKYRVPTAPEAGERLGVTISVGGGGMCLSVAEPIAAGTPLDLRLMIPGEPKPIAMTAQVVWSESKAPESTARCRIGVEILFIDRQDHDILTRYCVKKGGIA